MRYWIAVDIGGTQLRAGCYPDDSTAPEIIQKIPTQGEGEPLDRLFNLISSVWPAKQNVAAMGVAVAGPVNPYSGVVYVAPNIPGWVNLPLQQPLQDRFQVPVAIGNDANLAALGEWKFGAGRGFSSLLYVTVSTGIGAGVILDNKPVLGWQGLAGELGHITIEPDGLVCGCGQRGHLETIASGPAIARWVEAQIQQGVPSSLKQQIPLTAKKVAIAANAGDALAIAAFERAGTYLGRAFADFLHIYNPQVIILGGGVSQSGDLLLKPLKASLQKHVMSDHYLDHFVICTASLGDEVGLMGALALAHESLVSTP